jgi:hypothetical protein
MKRRVDSRLLVFLQPSTKSYHSFMGLSITEHNVLYYWLEDTANKTTSLNVQPAPGYVKCTEMKVLEEHSASDLRAEHSSRQN